jgi:HAE1 family hydrophobic/amphiphilic exporter-1
VETSGPATIYRQDRGRYIQISAAINPNGPGMGKAITDVRALLSSGKIKLPPGVRYEFVGQAEEFQNLIRSILIAAVLAVLFIYLILSSLYESFVIPFTIMLVLPLAACGAFYALGLTGTSLDIFSMIGLIMLLGIATKNGILLVDYANQKIGEGVNLKTAIVEAGRTRLRPILMTSVALIAGMLPVAIGLNEASKQRTSMGIAVIGGLVSSTLLTLIVIPAAYAYVERFREWTLRLFRKIGSREA